MDHLRGSKRISVNEPSCPLGLVRYGTQIKSIRSSSYECRTDDFKNVKSHQSLKKCDYEYESSTFDDLPAEVLIKIFEYFPVHGRQNLRLVCRRWHDIFCETLKLLRQERLICCEIYRTANTSTNVLRTLALSKRQILNLEFHYFEFENGDSFFWRKCGPRIHSLHFSECIMHSYTVLQVVLHCPHLTHVSWSFEKLKPEDTIVCPPQTVDLLLSDRVINENLISLDIHCSRGGGLSNYVLNGLFTVFPNIKKFGMWYTSFDEYDDERTLVDSRTCLTFDCVMQKIRSLASTAEHLDTTLRYRNGRWNVSWAPIIDTLDFRQLKEVTFDVSFENVDECTVYSFFSETVHLESVKLRGILGSLERFFCQFCVHLLENCAKLRHIQVQSRAIFLSADCLRRIVDSPLKTLCIQTQKLEIDAEFCRRADDDATAANYLLRTLVLDGDVKEEVQLMFVETFRQLHTLELHGTTDNVLQSIWKYQINLVSLRLLNAYYTTDCGFTGAEDSRRPAPGDREPSYSIRRLQRLEYFKVESVDEEWSISRRTLHEFVLLKLRYFVVDIDIKYELHDAFLDMLISMTSLESLSLKFIITPFAKCHEICGKLTKLRYLDIQDDSINGRKYTDLQYRRLFKRRSSLRAFIHKCNDSTSNSYFHHVLENKVMKKIPKRLYRLPSEKIGIFFVDSLWF